MVGTDINKEAIKNAIKNVEKNNLQNLIQGNYLTRIMQYNSFNSIFLFFSTGGFGMGKIIASGCR